MGSIGNILGHDPERGGQRYQTSEGAIYTHDPTENPIYPDGSRYLSVINSEGQKLPTAIIGPDGQRIG